MCTSYVRTYTYTGMARTKVPNGTLPWWYVHVYHGTRRRGRPLTETVLREAAMQALVRVHAHMLLARIVVEIRAAHIHRCRVGTVRTRVRTMVHVPREVPREVVCCDVFSAGNAPAAPD